MINVDFDAHTESLIDSIPVIEIATAVHQEIVIPAVDSTTTPPKRQQYHKDVAFTTSRCLIGKDDLGVSVPAFKTGNG